MSTEQVLSRLILLPVIIVADRAKSTLSVDFLNLLHVLRWERERLCWVFNEESVMHISSGMTLGLEEGVKVPERALNIPISWHLLETHLEEYLSELLADSHERMEMTSCAWLAHSVEIVALILLVFPRTRSEHL